MNRWTLMLGIALLSMGILVFFTSLYLAQELVEPSKNVPCYDSHGSKIQGLSCKGVEDRYEGPIIMMGLMGMAFSAMGLITIFLGFTGVEL